MPRLVMTGRSGSIGSAIARGLQNQYDELVSISHERFADDDIVADFTDDDALAKSLEQIPGPIDSVVFAHGIGRPGTCASITPQQWRYLLDVNLTSVYVIIRSLVEKMSDSASIVIIGSTAGLDHSPSNGVHYTVSKWGINGMVRHLSNEFGQRGIRVNAVCPGFVNNPTGRGTRTETELAARYSIVPLGRGAQPSEISAMVEFLLSDRASYITGALIPVTGGWLF